VEGAVRMQRKTLYAAQPEHEEALLEEAGFGDIALFYAALWIHGRIARA
jgi:hypothetical protein